MRKSKLPDNIRGEWIWSGTDPGRGDHYVFFRNEIQLASVVAEANFWICAHSSFRLFINGRHIGYGPAVSTRENSYVELYDLSYYLETGANTIGVVVYSSSAPEISCINKMPGLWCQLNIDGEPVLWSDGRWLSYGGLCYSDTVPLRGPGRGFSETVNMADFPQGWSESGFFDENWRKPDICRPLTMVDGVFEQSPLPPLNCEQADPIRPMSRGKFARKCGSTYVSFQPIRAKCSTGGTYVAETYVFSGDGDVEIPVNVRTGNDIRIFVNESKAFEYSVPEYSSALQPPLSLEKSAKSVHEAVAVLPLSKGWNRILAVQDCRHDRAGFFISIPDIGSDDVKFFVSPANDVPEGWMISGPLRIPYDRAKGSLKLENMRNSVLFTPSMSNLTDPASFLDSCMFEEIARSNEGSQVSDEARQGQYILYDLGRIMYGFPQISFEGAEGDMVDVVLSDRLSGNTPPAIGDSGRAVSSLSLAGGTFSWFTFAPAGVRYIMICVREASGPVKVESLTFFRISRYFEETFFESSDHMINIIWRSGIRTLKNTVIDTFLDSPAGYRGQFLVDSMIQSMAAAYSFGNYAVAEKSLRDFALAQHEDGNIPAICPSSFYFSVLDHAFLWPVWIQKFCQMGDFKKLLVELVPTLDRLLEFLDGIVDDSTWLINDVSSKPGLKCQIDHGDLDIGGISTAVNSLYCRALLSSSDIYEQAGLPEKAAACRHRKARISKNIRILNWDDKKGLFADSSANGKMSRDHSMQANVLAILGGVAEPDEYKKMFGKFFSDKAPFVKPGTSVTPYFAYFILETFFSLGYTEWCVNLMKSLWGNMLEKDPDCVWSFFPQFTEGAGRRDYCHGFGSSPNIFIIREMAGIRLAETGFRRIYFNPVFSVLDAVKINFHTTSGRINISWAPNEQGGIEIQIDSGFPLEVVPQMPKKVLGKCTFALGSSVSILEEAK